jgi:hypothetical protein
MSTTGTQYPPPGGDPILARLAEVVDRLEAIVNRLENPDTKGESDA